MPELGNLDLGEFSAKHPVAPSEFGPIFRARISESETVETQREPASIDLGACVSDFHLTARRAGIACQEQQCQRLILSLIAKRFLILTGLSGSGKTKLAQAFAAWITPNEPRRAYSLVAVGADWTSNENVVGYPNGLDETAYSSTPALKLIQQASKNWEEGKKDTP